MPNPQILGSVTAAEMAEVDRTLEQRIGIPLVASIERVAGVLSAFVRTVLPASAHRVLVLVGMGYNGADALATARQLASWGNEVVALLDHARDELKPLTQQQLVLAEQFGVRIFEPGALLPDTDLILDGLIGYGLSGTTLAEPTRELILASAKYDVPHIAIDIPSGINATTGRATTPAFRADTTLTLAYPKTGLTKLYSPPLVGKLLVVDAGIPPRWWQRLNQPTPDFSKTPLIEVEYPPAKVVQ
ncbi:MAG: NAD(P)H-hydrate epimerase [Patescibacteria group bacterium]